MKISVFGLGYVGCVSAACLARAGHRVVGVDVNPDRVARITGHRSPVLEPGLDDFLDVVVADGSLTATIDAAAAVAETDVALITVGTPALRDGEPDTSDVAQVGMHIGRALDGRVGAFTVVLRSTVLPGTTDRVLRPAVQQHAGSGVRLQIAVNPEFMREGSALQDFNRPPMVLVGSDDPGAVAVIREMYSHIEAPVVTTSVRAAEFVKYASNAFHALKVCFANEIAEICDATEADAAEVMRIFMMDRQLNLSSAYLRPGSAFGGSCLTKDVRALVWAAEQAAAYAPVLSSILPSNERRIQRSIDAILATGRQRVGMVGLAFKGGTDDLRNSPAVAVLEALVASGRSVQVLDRNVSAAIGAAGHRHLESQIPNLSSILCHDVDALIAHAEVLVIATATEDAKRARIQATPDCVVIDLTREVSSA